MTRKEKAKELQKVFDKMYGDAVCTLDYKEPLQLLISTQLAAQCTDARVNMVTPALFERYKNVSDFANADIVELEKYIKSTGFYHNKAKNIIACCKRLISDFDSKVPSKMEELISLPGTGRKTANIIIGDIFNKPAIVIDTHAKRITKLLGLTKFDDPTKIEFDLVNVLNKKSSSRFCHQLVLHGRAVCIARRPKCDICPVSHLCKHFTGK